MTAENHNVSGGFVAVEQYEGIVCVGQPVILKGISIRHLMAVVLVLG